MCGSYMFKTIVIETRKNSNVKGRDEETYVVACVGMGIANLLGERCCMKHYLEAL